jgi:hypothetical protein
MEERERRYSFVLSRTPHKFIVSVLLRRDEGGLYKSKGNKGVGSIP